MGGTNGSGIVCTARDVHYMSVVRGVKGVGGMCEMCMCLAWGGVCRGEWVGGLCLGFTHPVGTGGVWHVCLCLDCGVVGGWLCPGSGRVGWCYASLDYLWIWQVQVYGIIDKVKHVYF